MNLAKFQKPNSIRIRISSWKQCSLSSDVGGVVVKTVHLQNICVSLWKHENVWKLVWYYTNIGNQFSEKKKDLLCWTRWPAQLPIQVFNLKHRTGLILHTRTPSNIILYILLNRALWFVWWFDFSLSLLYQGPLYSITFDDE